MNPRGAIVLFGAGAVLALTVVGLRYAPRGEGTETAGEQVSTLAPEPTTAEPIEAPAEELPTTFVAFAADFEAFREWERHPIAGAMLPIGAEPGPAFVYASARAPEGTRRWPVGTVMVKTIEAGPPHEWIIHAMVKRGLPYNRDGTLGWEFFELSIPEAGGVPHVVWRGPGPPSGHGYAAMGTAADPDAIPLVCNDCHAASWQSDGVLTPALAFHP